MTIHRVTAIITDKRGRVLSVGKNSYIKTHTYQAECAKKAGYPDKIFLHAEIDAIVRCRDRSAHTISIYRYDSRGNPALAKPCEVCSLAIREFGIKKIIHT